MVGGSGTLETLRKSTLRADPVIIIDDAKRWMSAELTRAVASRLAGRARGEADRAMPVERPPYAGC
jgi:hypothetical protein